MFNNFTITVPRYSEKAYFKIYIIYVYMQFNYFVNYYFINNYPVKRFLPHDTLQTHSIRSNFKFVQKIKLIKID
jgi:hypothetical protein